MEILSYGYRGLGVMKHRNGTLYKFQEMGCGEGLSIYTDDERLMNTIHLENPGYIAQKDLDLAEFVIDGMEITAEFLADAEKRKQAANDEIEIVFEQLLVSA